MVGVGLKFNFFPLTLNIDGVIDVKLYGCICLISCHLYVPKSLLPIQFLKFTTYFNGDG